MKTTFISRIKLVSLWMLVLLFSAANQAFAGVYELVPSLDTPHTNLRSYCLLAENPVLIDGSLDFQKTIFTPIPENFLFQPDQTYWLKFSIKCRQADPSEHWINLGSYDEVALYRNQQYTGKTGRAINRADRMHPVHQGWLSLMPLSEKTADYYFRIKTGRFRSPHTLNASLTSIELLEQSRNLQIKNNLPFYFFRISILAIIAFMFLLSFAQFITNRDETYRCYGLYLLLTFFYLLISFEQKSSFSFFIQNHFAAYFQALIIPSLMLSYFFYTQFVRCILDTRSKQVHFDGLLSNYGLMTLFFVIMDVVIGFIFRANFYPHLRSAILIISFAFAMYIYFRIWKTKGIVAKLVLTGSLIFSLGSFLGFLFTTFWKLPKGLGIFSDGLTYMQLSVLIEVLFFTVALAYRARQIEKDKAAANANLITEIYEKEKLVYQNEKNKEFEARRSQFFADTNHELRTPLTVIKGMAENMENDNLQRNIILKNTTNMLRLINNMLDLARAESGDVSVNLLQDNFVSFCESQIEAWTYFSKTKDIEVIFQASEKLILMDFDDRKMEQIISNLMSNAVKFTPAGGTITVTAKEEENVLVLIIKDTGSGISPQDLPNVFDRYYRAKHSNTNYVEGTGIGLALVKKLVELADGSIEVISEPDVSTSFILNFPIKKLAPYGKAKSSLSSIQEIDQSDDVMTSSAPANAPTLLIVEDNPEILSHLKYSLGQWYNIITAVNGSEGISKANQFSPDLIISDIRMPVQDGLTLCDTLKKDISTSHIPIILLTASSTNEDKIKGLQRGADAYITKPFSQIELKLRIENLLQVKKTLHVYFSKNIDRETIRKSNTSKEDQEFLGKLVRYIKNNIDDDQLDVQRMMSVVNVSRPTLHSKLKSLTGLSASQFKKQIKMQEAKRLLNDGQRNISDLAYQLGYKYPNNFSKDFKKWYGVTPKKFGQ